MNTNYEYRNLREVSLEHIRMELCKQDMDDIRKKSKNLPTTHNQAHSKLKKVRKVYVALMRFINHSTNGWMLLHYEIN